MLQNMFRIWKCHEPKPVHLFWVLLTHQHVGLLFRISQPETVSNGRHGISMHFWPLLANSSELSSQNVHKHESLCNSNFNFLVHFSWSWFMLNSSKFQASSKILGFSCHCGEIPPCSAPEILHSPCHKHRGKVCPSGKRIWSDCWRKRNSKWKIMCIRLYVRIITVQLQSKKIKLLQK